MKQRPNNHENTLRTILVPFDFSDVADHAMWHSVKIAGQVKVSLTMLHVFDKTGDTPLYNKDPVFLNLKKNLEERKNQYQQDVLHEIQAHVRPGNLFKVISHVAAEVKPWMMVMGTHGKQGLQHLYGSYALRVVLDASCPIMVVQDRPADAGYRRIVLPVNGDTDPVRVSGWLSDFCQLFSPEIHILRSGEISPERMEAVSGYSGQITKQLKACNLSFTVADAGNADEFSQQVVRYAAANRADLVATMTTPSATATGYMLSDWNERLMFNPDRIPVLFIDRADQLG